MISWSLAHLMQNIPYRSSDRWMNEYWALEEWCWQGKTKVLAEKPVPVPICHHTTDNDWAGLKPRPQGWQSSTENVFLVDKYSVSKTRTVYYQKYDVCAQLLYTHNEDNQGTIWHETGKNVIYILNLMINCCKQNNSYDIFVNCNWVDTQWQYIWESHSGEYMDYRFTDVMPYIQVDR